MSGSSVTSMGDLFKGLDIKLADEAETAETPEEGGEN